MRAGLREEVSGEIAIETYKLSELILECQNRKNKTCYGEVSVRGQRMSLDKSVDCGTYCYNFKL